MIFTSFLPSSASALDAQLNYYWDDKCSNYANEMHVTDNFDGKYTNYYIPSTWSATLPIATRQVDVIVLFTPGRIVQVMRRMRRTALQWRAWFQVIPLRYAILKFNGCWKAS
jgi:hypothetical protein